MTIDRRDVLSGVSVLAAGAAAVGAMTGAPGPAEAKGKMATWEDHEAVRRTFTMYCYNIDGHKPDDLAALFTEDAVWDGGALGKREGRQGIKDLGNFIFDTYGPGGVRHQLVNTLVSVDGDTAKVETYFNVLQGKPGQPISFLASGTYNVDLVKQGGTWQIKHLLLTQAFAG